MVLASTIFGSSRADPLSGLCEELEKISATGCPIESISINIDIPTSAECNTGDGWGLLEKVLTKKDAWLGLREVSLKIRVSNYGEDRASEVIRDGLNKLQDTQFKELLVCEAFNFNFNFEVYTTLFGDFREEG